MRRNEIFIEHYTPVIILRYNTLYIYQELGGKCMSTSKIYLPAWLSTGMVFQHSTIQVLCGYIDPDASIRLEVTKSPTDGRKVSKLDLEYGVVFEDKVQADSTGKFLFELPPQKPSVDEYTFLFVSGSCRLQISHLQCGDVWFILGSNPFSLPIARTEAPKTPLKDSSLRLVRFFSEHIEEKKDLFTPSVWQSPSDDNIEKKDKSSGEDLSEEPEELSEEQIFRGPDMAPFLIRFLSGHWCTLRNTQDLAKISAVGFSMAYNLCDQLRYPVGIVDLAAKGAGITSWIDPERLTEEEVQLFEDIPEESMTRHAKCYQALTGFLEMNIRGVVFAPDVGDCVFIKQYVKLLNIFLENLGSILGPKKISQRKNIPSLILLQLATDRLPEGNPFSYVHFNEVLAVSRKHFTFPVGVLAQHDLLLPDKTYAFHIGRRLSYIALGQHFTPKMPSSSPECVDVEVVGNKILLTFANSGDGLKLAENESILRGFCICGENRVYRPAQSKILHGVRVMVWHDDIADPIGVTYGYYPWPHFSNFRSKSDLLVLPFRFDREKANYSPDISFANCDSLTYIGINEPDDIPQILPVFEQRQGECEFVSERLNKTEGAASVHINYVTEKKHFSFAPILRYASMYKPIDLMSFKKIRFDIFNPDEREKEVEVSGYLGKATIAAALRWQTITLRCKDPVLLEDLTFAFRDEAPRGEIYIDHIRFIP